ncbi:NAD(P)H-binding protein [Tsukamurella soli]|uniref:SDR family oxidoreductase n=1 Tax=Tsukamurella soli TaxID=644556 RepID=A0ABP8JQB0_9ACTN
MSIAVTGGNGEFGRAVLAQLRDRTRESIVTTVRDVAKADKLPGIDYRAGDFDYPDALRGSLVGVDTVLVNATFFGPDPSLRLPRVTAAIGAATEAGVERIVLTSWPRLETSTMPSVQNYRALERTVQAAGPSWTILRLNIGMADALARDVVWGRQMGELVAPARDASAAPAAIPDLAAATAIALVDRRRDGDTLELTGPQDLDWTDLADAAGVPFRAVSDEDYTAYLTENFGFPPETTALLTALYADFREGRSSATGTLPDLLGRPAVPGIEAVRARVALFPAQ